MHLCLNTALYLIISLFFSNNPLNFETFGLFSGPSQCKEQIANSAIRIRYILNTFRFPLSVVLS